MQYYIIRLFIQTRSNTIVRLDPSRLLTKLEATFTDLSWTDDLYDKENQSYIELEERVVNTVGNLISAPFTLVDIFRFS